MLLDGTKTSTTAPAVDTANQNQEQQPSKIARKKKRGRKARAKTQNNKPKEKEENQLNDKQKLFCHEYIQDFDRSRAYLAAYPDSKNPRQDAYNLLTKSYVQKFLDKIKDTITAKLEITEERIVSGIAKIGFSETSKDRDKLKALELLGLYRNLFKKDQAPTGVNVPLMELLEAFKAQGVTP